MRDRLIELLKNAPLLDVLTDEEEWEISADYLLENGVIVPPCKKGDKVFAILYAPISQKYYVAEKEVLHAKSIDGFWYFDIDNGSKTLTFQMGEKVFLTKEEAEQALKGGAE